MKIKNLLNDLRSRLGDEVFMLVVSSLVTKKNILDAADFILDILEDLTAKTKIKADDVAVRKVRDALNIPDNDEPKVIEKPVQ